MIRDVLIRPVLNGYIVTVGCARVVFTSTQDLVSAVHEYLDDPEGVEDKWGDDSLNAEHFPMTGNLPEQPRSAAAEAAQGMMPDRGRR